MNRFGRIDRALVVALSIVGAWRPALAAEFIGLGFFPDCPDPTNIVGCQSAGGAVSEDGSVIVGVCTRPPDYESHAFRWTESDGMTSLGKGYIPRALSADGRVVVGDSELGHAVRWTESQGWSVLAFNSQAFGVSANGSVVVGDGPNGAFRWTAATGVEPLGTLTGYDRSSARAVSADGTRVVGTASLNSGLGMQAFRWTATERLVGLGFLPGYPGYSQAFSVSGDGTIVVGTAQSEGFRWNSSAGMVGFGSFQGSPIAGGRVSADGQTIVGSYSTVWRATTGWRALRDILADDGINLAGWSLQGISGVSGTGRVMAGTGSERFGSNPEIIRTEAWRAALPEPYGLLSAVAALSSLACVNEFRRGRQSRARRFWENESERIQADGPLSAYSERMGNNHRSAESRRSQ